MTIVAKHSEDDLRPRIEQALSRQEPVSPAEAANRRAREKTNRRNAKLARKALKNGFDIDRLDALARDYADERRARLADGRRRAIKGPTKLWKQLTGLPAILLDPPDAMSVTVDSVTFIRSFAGAGAVADSHVGSSDNWARYRLEVSGGAVTSSGTGRLSFFTVWRNPKNKRITAAVGVQLVANMHLSVDAEWNGVAAWFIGGSEARATVHARITVT